MGKVKKHTSSEKKRKHHQVDIHHDDHDTINNDDDDIELDPMEIELVVQQKQKQNQQAAHHSDDDNENENDHDNDGDADVVTSSTTTTTATTTQSSKSHRRVTDPLPTYNNIIGLQQALGDIQLPSNFPWPEYMTLTCEQSLYRSMVDSGYTDVHDDLGRESTFYSVTLAGVLAGIERMKSYNIGIYRPDDYFAEMIKPDIHMQKIKHRLLTEKQRIDTVNQRKTANEQRKIQKSIHVEKIKEKSQIKKRAKMDAENYQNMSRNRDEFKIQRSTLPIIDQTLKANRNKNSRHTDESLQSSQHTSRNKVNYRRKHKDEKYGFGGKKKHLKDNTAESAADMRKFNSNRNRSEFGSSSSRGGRFNRSISGSGAKRAGKSIRNKMRW